VVPRFPVGCLPNPEIAASLVLDPTTLDERLQGLRSTIEGVAQSAVRSFGRWLRRHWLEAAAFTAVLAVAVAVRVVHLGTIPRIITGDELENLQTAIRVNIGKGPGVFGFDWAGRPALNLYPLAWTVRVFGGSVADFRMFPVILSLLTIVLFYAVARETMSAPAALAAMTLLATNLWFLNFSRTAWDNIGAPLFAIGACWTTTRALKTPGRAAFAWWMATGLFVTAGLYGYFTGRLIFASVTLIVFIAVAAKEAPWRRTLAGLLLAGALSAVLFAPMARNIFRHWDYFTSRSNVVSVFNTKRADGTKRNGWGVAKDNVLPNYRGLVLQQGSELQRGPYNARYHPHLRPALGFIAMHLFWAGLVLAALRWRRTYAWFPFFIPMFVSEVFSGDTPDMGRAIIFAPFYFLFIGLTFEEILRRSSRPLWYGASALAIGAAVAFVSVREVRGYFDWQGQEATQTQRMPGIDHCEYALWKTGIDAAARVSGNLDVARFDRDRRALNCSSVVAKQLGAAPPAPAPSALPTARPTTATAAASPAAAAATPSTATEERDTQRRHDLDQISGALLRYYGKKGTYPSTNAQVETLCAYPGLDAGCELAPYLDPIPLDPKGRGYWYMSDGATFAVYAQLEANVRECAEIPQGFVDFAGIYCVTGSAPP
jgi:hypothetical protein